MKKVLVVVDVQRDFIDGALASPEVAEIVGGIRELAEQVLREGGEVLFTMDTHREDDCEAEIPPVEALSVPRHCIEGTPGWDIAPELADLAEGNLIPKTEFVSHKLADVIRERAGDCPEIEICGIYTDICVVSNALTLRGAFPGSVIRCNGKLCVATSEKKHKEALSVMRSNLVKEIR